MGNARRLRRKQPSRDDIWHLDEVAVAIAGTKHWLWRAVDQDGYVRDEIVQSRRNTKAAKRLLTRLLKKQGIAPISNLEAVGQVLQLSDCSIQFAFSAFYIFVF